MPDKLWIPMLLIGLALLVGCARSGEALEPRGGSTTNEPSEIVSAESTEQAYGNLYLGEVGPPESGPVALFVHEDGSAVMAVAADDLDLSLVLNGSFSGNRLDLEGDGGNARVTGRYQAAGFELSLTARGEGFFILRLREAEEGTSLYLSNPDDLLAALIVLPDGEVQGFAAVKGDGGLVYERLCIEDTETIPNRRTAATCQSQLEITLMMVAD